MSLQASDEYQEVPLLDADRLVPWLYSPTTKVEIEREGVPFQHDPLPSPQALNERLALAADSGLEWALLDAPPARSAWVLDLWSDRPEMSARLQRMLKAGCVSIADLRAALERFLAAQSAS